MLTKSKKLISFLLTFLIVPVSLYLVTYADDSTFPFEDQITNYGGTRYYDETGSEVTESPVLGENAAVSAAKTITGTDVENEFIIDLEVKTSADISDVNMSSDAAVVLVLDISDSMDNDNRIGDLREAAKAFLDSYAASADGAKRYISLVTFNSTASIKETWIDISDPTNLTAMKTMIESLETVKNLTNGSTFMQGGLVFARNLMSTKAIDALQVSEAGSTPIANRSVILFSDGEANYYVSGTTSRSTYNIADWKANDGGVKIAKGQAVIAANQVKNGTSFTVSYVKYDKYTSKLYTVAYSQDAPADWLRDSISSGPDYAFSGTTAAELKDIFETINGSITRWAEAWVVTDPMGENIEFISDISQNDIDSGLLKFDPNVKTLTWDLKQAAPDSDGGTGIHTYKYSYTIKLDTTSSTFASDTLYPTNKTTELTYVMVDNKEITSDVMTAAFFVPEVEGYAGSFSFTKVGDNTEILVGCEFTLTNRNKEDHLFLVESEAVTGKLSFANIPSGHTYLLKETSIPDEYRDTYLQSSETYTVTVSYGSATIKDSQGNAVTNDFTFNNPLREPLRETPVKSVAGNSAAGKDGVGVAVGDEITYEISYANYDSAPATIVITDILPTGVDFVSADNGGTKSGSVVTWTLTNVAAKVGGTVQVVVKVNVSAVTKIENEAAVQVGSNAADTTNKVENPVINPETPVNVTYVPNGGTGTMADPNSPYIVNSEVIILDNRFTRSGYTFTGFKIQGDKSGTVYSSAADAITGTSGRFTITQDTVLLARWKPLGSITINKYGEKDGDTLLPDAVFEIEQFIGTDPTEVQLAADANWKTIYWDNTASEWVDTDTGYIFKTDGSNGLEFSNLSEATYRITETVPPASSNANYALLQYPIVITVPFESTTSPDTGYTGNWTEDNGKYYYYDLTYTVTDATVLELPSSGAGNWSPRIYVLIGITILIAASVYILRQKYKRSQ